VGQRQLKPKNKMQQTIKNAIEIAQRGGAVAAGDWTTGTGNYIHKRAIPSLCEEIKASEVATLPGKSGLAARRLLKKRPRIRKLIVVTNWRELNKLTTNNQKTK